MQFDDPELAEAMRDPVLRPIIQGMQRNFELQMESVLGPLNQKLDSFGSSFKAREEQAAYEREKATWENEFVSAGNRVAADLGLQEKFADVPEVGQAVLDMAMAAMDGLISDPRWQDLPPVQRQRVFDARLKERAESVVNGIEGLVQARLDQRMGKAKAAKSAVPAGAAMGGVSGMPPKDPDKELWRTGKIDDEEYMRRATRRAMSGE
jgi:hypothetical protein